MLKSEMGGITMKKLISIITVFVACLVLSACNTTNENSDVSETAESNISFEGLELVRAGISDRAVFNDLGALEEFSDIAVVGKFIDDAVQEISYDYEPYFEKDIVTDVVSYNTIEVSEVLFGDVKVGDKLKIGQSYGVVDDRLISFDRLTPMQKGDEWVFFLVYAPFLEESYWCSSDTFGRYPVTSAENAPMPLSDSPDLGVFNEEDFKWDIYNEILEKYDI